MRKFIIILLGTLLCSCMRNFDPAKDSDVGSILLHADLMSITKNIEVMEGECFEDGKLSEEDAEMFCMRVSAYCYGSDGRLIEKQAKNYTSFKEGADFEFRLLEKGKAYQFYLVANLRELYAEGAEADIWFHQQTESLESFHIGRILSSLAYADIIGMASGVIYLDRRSESAEFTMQHLGAPCHIIFHDTQNVSEIIFYYSGLADFSILGPETFKSLKWSPNTIDLSDVTEVTDEYHYYCYIIPNTDGKSTFDYQVSYADETPALKVSQAVELEIGRQSRIHINCLTGELICETI